MGVGSTIYKLEKPQQMRLAVEAIAVSMGRCLKPDQTIDIEQFDALRISKTSSQVVGRMS